MSLRTGTPNILSIVIMLAQRRRTLLFNLSLSQSRLTQRSLLRSAGINDTTQIGKSELQSIDPCDEISPLVVPFSKFC